MGFFAHIHRVGVGGGSPGADAPQPPDALGSLNPTAPSEREPVLDALRGFAILGILLVNIEVMRGSDWLVVMGGGAVEASDLSDRIVRFAVGWLATGKFVSSLAILFGIGAALIPARSVRAGDSPRPLLARRYAWLMAFGIAHTLLFPGDILFLYGVTGLALLAFVMLPVRTMFAASASILAIFSLLGLRYWGSAQTDLAQYGGEPSADSLQAFVLEERAQSAAAFVSGSWNDIFLAQASQGLLLQSTQLLVLPWILALFLFGFAIARSGMLSALRAHTAWLRAGAWIGLAIGLPVNLGLGFVGPLAGFGAPADTEPIWVTRWASFAQLVGAPVLAVGYLSGLTLLWLRRRPSAALVAVGRMALTAYLLQSALALAVFGGLALYDQLSTTSALLVVAGIWLLLLAICPLWLRWFRFGPAEWLWRRLTYGPGRAGP